MTENNWYSRFVRIPIKYNGTWIATVHINRNNLGNLQFTIEGTQGIETEIIEEEDS